MVNARPRASSASYLESLPSLLAPIFEQVQHTTANHRKNQVSLRNVQEQCSGITEASPKGLRLIGEKAFNSAFIDMVNRILPVKKAVPVADRVVKFVAGYVTYTTEQG
jgi:condensin complex subunit 3